MTARNYPTRKQLQDLPMGFIASVFQRFCFALDVHVLSRLIKQIAMQQSNGLVYGESTYLTDMFTPLPTYNVLQNSSVFAIS